MPDAGFPTKNNTLETGHSLRLGSCITKWDNKFFPAPTIGFVSKKISFIQTVYNE
jgi:hypothetical protein